MDGNSVVSGLGALARNLVPFIVGALAVLMGLALMFSAARAMYRLNGRGADPGIGTLSWGRVAGQAFIGAMLLQYARTMQDVSMLAFGSPIQDASAVMAYFPAAQGMGRWTEVMNVALLWVVTLGWIFGLRGLLQWNKAISGGGSAGQNGDLMWGGFWHLIGGAAMVNLAGALRALFG
ncbi:MAG: hypothetical protein K0Q43_66 [Ramlibacter sp.]|jgi:hypothetical protein|nr:hypothetical protein [Ramlibacter sp.]